MAAEETPRSAPDIGLALSLSGADLDDGLDKWLAPVTAGRFDSVWSLENPLVDQAEPLVWLAAAATMAPGAGIGTAALIAPTRHPVLLARQLATLDHLASGRLTIGVTVGRRRADYDLTGTEFTKRGQILDETIDTLRVIWSDSGVDVSNRFWRLHTHEPIGIKPCTAAGPAILVGGHADVALRRAALRGAGYLAGATSGPSHALAARGRLLDLLDKQGRDPRMFRFVANVFVVIDSSPQAGIKHASEIFQRRHGGPPPYDPATVVAAGPAHVVAEGIRRLVTGGYSGINLIPVDMTIDQIDAAGEVAALVRA